MRQLSKIEELTNNNYQVEEMERWKLISMSNKLEPILLELDQRSSWKRPEKLIEQRVAGRGGEGDRAKEQRPAGEVDAMMPD